MRNDHNGGATLRRARLGDLRFDEDGLRLLLAGMGVDDLTAVQVDALLDRTQGWPMAVRIAATELSRGDHDEAIERVRGSHPHLEGFLRREVLDQLPARSRRFLVRTSILSELEGPLCDAVTGETGSAALLRRLEQDGLIIRVASATGAACRCQPLLRELLRRDLRSSTTDDEDALLARAATWHLDRGEVEAAGDLLVQAGRWDRLLELVDRHGPGMIQRGRAEPLLGWLAAVPKTRAVRRRGVALRRAVVLTIVGRTEMAEQVVHDAHLSSSPGEQALLDSLSAAWAFLHGAPEASIRSADAVLAVVEGLGPTDVPDVFGMTSPPALESLASVAAACSRWFLGETAASRDQLIDTLRRPMVPPPWRIQALAGLAKLEAWSGNLRLADQHAREAWRVARAAGLDAHPATCEILLVQAHVLRERGRLAQSLELLDAAAPLAAEHRRALTLALLAVERSMWQLAAGNPERGLEVIEQLRVLRTPTLPPVVTGRLAATEVRLHLAAGDVRRAAAVPLEGMPDPAAAGAGVQLAVARGDLDAADEIIGAWPAGDDPRASIERELWTAVQEFNTGQRRSARQRIAAVVDDAQPEGHVRLFLDGGAPVRRLLRAVAVTSESAYVTQLVNAWPSTVGGGELGMSRREMDVLRYLPTPLSNAEIAANLYISLNTLKTHLQSVYRKLEVPGRREAVERAEALGIA